MKTLANISSMRAALNSAYCMRATLAGRKRQMANGDISNGEAFYYKEGQHAVNGNGNGKNSHEKLDLPPEVKKISTIAGKRWSTPTMTIELRGDVLEIRDGFGNIVDAVVLDKTSLSKTQVSPRNA